MSRPRSSRAPAEPGQVVAAYGRRYRVELEAGAEIDCVTRGKKTDVACGDIVQAASTGSGTGVIELVTPRRTLFYRSDARRQKLIAANVTQVVVVVAAEPPYSEDLVNRSAARRVTVIVAAQAPARGYRARSRRMAAATTPSGAARAR